jgi:hypothetical protein
VALATRGHEVHLMETLHGTMEHLTVIRIDPHEVTEAHRAQVLASKGAKHDAAGRAVREDDLRRAGIEPWAWVINDSVAAAQVTSPLLLARAHNELREIEAVASQHAKRYALLPLLKEEPVGVKRLTQLAAKLTPSF